MIVIVVGINDHIQRIEVKGIRQIIMHDWRSISSPAID